MQKSPYWLDAPEDHDYPAAESYLSLLMAEQDAQALVAKLQAAPMTAFKAKDILRASCLPHLGEENRHVAKNLQKMQTGKRLSPVLLARGQKLVIADGYHRCCAVYLLDEDAEIPCKIV
ncbi:MAG: hypothetical protein JO171_06795 [Paludibacterium sp.]|uniref:hypothetical protein n=1 Tax=Paludibacterium sp. TaxID=1917523 RepID=UPI0025E43015|nr:hypothetical protein [Paludibacterium sp.]MBV8046840.1 hypothetical protein [Paludibacterium sp.]MBV8646877.1 hypothetical protein [Paludibacterium sp.]